MSLVSVEYQVLGRVQGVFFRKFTKKKADELKLRGFVKNSIDTSVIGVIEGPQEPILRMKNWLSTQGSPYSRIDSCLFTNERTINEYEYNSFEIRH